MEVEKQSRGLLNALNCNSLWNYFPAFVDVVSGFAATLKTACGTAKLTSWDNAHLPSAPRYSICRPGSRAKDARRHTINSARLQASSHFFSTGIFAGGKSGSSATLRPLPAPRALGAYSLNCAASIVRAFVRMALVGGILRRVFSPRCQDAKACRSTTSPSFMMIRLKLRHSLGLCHFGSFV